MLIGLDIDGVVADFITPFLRLLGERAGSGPIDPQSITDPNFMDHPFLTKEIILGCMEQVSYDPKFWQQLAPLPTAEQWRSLDRIGLEQRLVFVTHRWERDTYDINRVTCDWLRAHGVSNPLVYFTQEKKSQLVKKLQIDLFVDDRHENCEDVATQTDAVVLMPHRPYNQTFAHPKVQRIRDLDDLFAYLDQA
jgi:uncharacterized HAD superfamily protein